MIAVNFEKGRPSAVAYGSLWQYDYGQILRIQGINLPPAVEIHFSLRDAGGEAVTRVGVTRDGVTDVTIPDSMLENGDTAQDYRIYAFVYLTDDTSGETARKIILPVKSRPKPEAFDKPEDTELFREAIAAVNEAVDRAEAVMTSAEESAEESRNNADQTGNDLAAVQELAEQVEVNADAVAQDKQSVANMLSQTQTAAGNVALSEQAAKASAEATKQAQAGAEAAENAAAQYAAEAKEDRQMIEDAKDVVMQLGQEVADNKAAVDRIVAEFSQTAESAVQNVNTAGSTQVTNVESAGTTQVAAVKSEGDTQVQRVQDAAAEIAADREQIAENAALLAALGLSVVDGAICIAFKEE